ncbi:hypothetical protein Hanom_Chr17g01540431 [Helianthus anomalus]
MYNCGQLGCPDFSCTSTLDSLLENKPLLFNISSSNNPIYRSQTSSFIIIIASKHYLLLSSLLRLII